jgi:hypothetical protein
MQNPAWPGLGALLLIAIFVILAFRQGMKVKKPPEGVPPERWPHG